VRREDPEMTQDSKGSDGWQDPASENMQVVLGSDALLSDGRYYEAKLTEAPVCLVNTFYGDGCDKEEKGNVGKVATYMACQTACSQIRTKEDREDESYNTKKLQNKDAVFDRFAYTHAWGYCKCCQSAIVKVVADAGYGITIGELNCVEPQVTSCASITCTDSDRPRNKGKWVICSDANPCTEITCCQAKLDITAACVNKNKCWTEMEQMGLSPTEWKQFQCNCMTSLPLEDVENPELCAPWIDCLSAGHDEGKYFISASAEALVHLQFKLVRSGEGAGLQQFSGRQVPDQTDCLDPYPVLIENIECDCWPDLKAACADQQTLHGQDLRECYRLNMCADSDICHTWKTGTDGNNGYCTPAEIAGPAFLLAVQGMRKPERTVLADIFQGRRQPPANISEFDAAVLEKSLSGKACSRTTR